uniref:G-protein coupled receptors family 1 profile domain-containing protein n=1 Tax=Nothobranchius furzeri TaxID=105023 RepID=A0A8C6LXP2_NOTFU
MNTLPDVELCFPQLLNTSCRKPLQKHAENMFINLLLSCISLFTVALNLLVIISISHFRQLHTPTNLFLLSLAVSDFLVGLLLMPIRILLTGGCWVLGSFMCGVFHLFSYTLTSASVGNMVLISADRYVAICDPLHYQTKVTNMRVQILILKDFLKHPDRYNSCVGECVLVTDFFTGVFDVILTFIGPITVIIVLYMRVFLVAVSQARAMRCHIASVTLRGSVPVTAKKSERKAATALGVVVLVFLICFCPYFYPSLAGHDLFSTETFSVFASWLLYSNSCLNPIIYVLFYPWFRQAVKLIFTHLILHSESCTVQLTL